MSAAEKEPVYPCSFYARLFGLTERRIQSLAKEGVIPKSGRGQYPLISTIKGYVKYLQDRSLGQHNAGPQELQHEKVRLTKANADKAELEVAVLSGSLIPEETVRTVWGYILNAFRQKVLSIPTKTAPRLLNISDLKVVESALRTACFEALAELAEYDPKDFGIHVSSSEGDGVPGCSTTNDDGERMGRSIQDAE